MAYNVNERYREIVYSGGAIYKCSLKINNKEVPYKQIASIKISNPIIDKNTNYFYVGSYVAQKLTIKFKNLENLEIQSNNSVSLDISLNVDGQEVSVPIGKFLIDDLSENYFETCEITCLDYSIKAKNNIDYSPCFTNGKATIDEIFEYICNYFNIEFDPNYPKTNGDIEIGVYDNSISGKRYISYIAELKGCNAKHGRDGVLYLKPIKQVSNVTINALKSKSWKLGEKYQISGVTYDDGARLFKAGTTTNNTLFIRNDNPFIQDQTTIDNIYNVVKDTTIWNLKTENYGDVSIDPWDNITYQLGDKTYNTLMNVDITYEMNISSTNEVKLPTKQQEQTTNIVGGDNQSKLLRIGRDIDLVNGEIKDLSEKVVDISATASGIKNIDITNGYKGNLHKLDIWGNLELPIVGGSNGSNATETGYAMTGHSIVKSTKKYLKPLIVGNFVVNNFKIEVKQNNVVYKEYILDDMKNLYQIGSVHDTFNYLEGKISITRNIGISLDGTKYILSEPYVEELKSFYIEVPEGNYTISVNHSLNMSAEYLTQNQYTNTFATQVDVESSIKIATDEVLIESKREILDSGDELIASINTKSSGDVLINASKTINFDSTEFNVTTEKMKITIGTDENKKDLINASGVLTNLIYNGYTRGNMVTGTGDYIPLGHVGGGDTADTQRNELVFSFRTPTNFTILSANIYLSHSPINWSYENTSVVGNTRNLEIYKGQNIEDLKINYNTINFVMNTSGITLNRIYNALGSSGFTGDKNKTTSTKSIDLKNYIDTDKDNYFVIKDSNATVYTTNRDIFDRTGGIFGYLEIIGYSHI